jgi:nucleotide-binding universal stress UspA family protein
MKKQSVALFIDFSAPSESQLLAAAAWVEGNIADIYIFHAFNPAPGYMGYGSEGSKLTVEEMDCRLQDTVSKLQEMTGDGCTIEGKLIEGDPVDKVPAEIEIVNPDITIMGSHGHGRLHDLFIGSVLHSVLKKSDIPVLIVPPDVHIDRTNGFKEVLVALDLSEASQKVLAVGAHAAEQRGDTLHLAHVVIPPSTVVEGVAVENFGPAIIQERTKSAEAILQKRIEELEGSFENTAIKTHILIGPAAQAIDTAAIDLDADLLVLGSHGHGIIYSILIGSTTQHLLYHCKKPMLVVPI